MCPLLNFRGFSVTITHNPLISILTVTHKLPNGVKTHFFEELENGRCLILPRNADEMQEMLKLVLYDPSFYTFHHRFREAMVKLQMPNYEYLERSKCRGLSGHNNGGKERGGVG